MPKHHKEITVVSPDTQKALDAFDIICDRLPGYQTAKDVVRAALQNAGGWRKISEAKKDGTGYLVRDYYQHNNERLEDGRLSQTGPDGFGIVVARFDNQHGWHVAASVTGGKYIRLINPTHYMELPPAPSENEGR